MLGFSKGVTCFYRKIKSGRGGKGTGRLNGPAHPHILHLKMALIEVSFYSVIPKWNNNTLSSQWGVGWQQAFFSHSLSN